MGLLFEGGLEHELAQVGWGVTAEVLRVELLVGGAGRFFHRFIAMEGCLLNISIWDR